jgi:hypothetical protein
MGKRALVHLSPFPGGRPGIGGPKVGHTPQVEQFDWDPDIAFGLKFFSPDAVSASNQTYGLPETVELRR